MKKLPVLLFGLLLIWGCSKETIQPNLSFDKSQDPLSTAEIDQIIKDQLLETNRFYWNNVEPYVLWSALTHSDSLLSIGYQPADEKNINEKMNKIDLSSPKWTEARNKILRQIVAVKNETEGTNITIDELEVWISDRLPFIQIKTGNRAIVETLRQMEEVRYVDPLGYGQTLTGAVERSSGSGCGGSAESSLPTGDYTNYGTNGIAPWNYDNTKIQQAWTQSEGAGVTVGLIDTGVSDDQDNLGPEFAVGNSTGRTIEKYSTYVTCSGWWWWRTCTNDGPHDQCGHGTSMAGYIAAPLGTSAEATMGVAYKANLISYRATGDVVINNSEERQGVTDALYELGDRSDVDIISMSIGDLFYIGQVADAVVYAYNEDKLIFAAAGTSLWWTNWFGVIFPAYMAETVAVTGVTDHPTNLVECDICHYGSEVDFAIIMQRDNDADRVSLTLHTEDDSPVNWPKYVGGSSCATATTAGIAALVWSENPSHSRQDVIDDLKQAASEYPNRDSDFGWGILDAFEAVD